MARTSSFTFQEQEEIKQQIWNGAKNTKICKDFNLQPGTVSAIKAGKIWSSVPWPDGSVGPIPKLMKDMAKTPVIDLDRELRVGLIHIPGAYEKLLDAARAAGYQSVHQFHIGNRDDMLRSQRTDLTTLFRRAGRDTPAPPPLISPEPTEEKSAAR